MNFRKIILLFVIAAVAGCSDDGDYNDRHGDKAVIPPEGTVLTMMTYNIYGARASSGPPADLDALAAVIKAQDPDFVALQEVDVYTNRTGPTVHQAKELGEKLGMYWHFTKAIERDGGSYGDAVLSKYEILETQDYILPVTATLSGENRSVCIIKVEIEGRELFVGSTHFDHLSNDANRLLQAEEMRKVVAAVGGDLIIGGDFNALPSSETISIVSSYMTLGCKGNCGYTFPSDEPNRTIDYIMYTPLENFAVHNYEVIAEKNASDHRPVVAALRFRTEPNEWETGGNE